MQEGPVIFIVMQITYVRKHKFVPLESRFLAFRCILEENCKSSGPLQFLEPQNGAGSFEFVRLKFVLFTYLSFICPFIPHI